MAGRERQQDQERASPAAERKRHRRDMSDNEASEHRIAGPEQRGERQQQIRLVGQPAADAGGSGSRRARHGGIPLVDLATTAQRSNGGPLCRNFKSAAPAQRRHGSPGPCLASICPRLSPIVAAAALQIGKQATRLTANSLWKQSFGGNYAGRQQPLFLASRGFILYPKQSATAGIRFM